VGDRARNACSVPASIPASPNLEQSPGPDIPAFGSAADHGECRGLARTRETLDALDAVWRAEDILNNGLLGAGETRVLVGK
jgi:hypothetical protein